MPVFVLEEAGGFSGVIEKDTVVEAEVVTVSLQTKPFKDDDGNDVKKIVFKFRIDQPGSEYDGTLLWGETYPSFTTHPRNRLRQWTESLLDTQLPVGYTLDTESLVGARCRIVVDVYEKKDGEKRNQVGDVLPLVVRSYV